MGSAIVGTGSYLPERIIDNDELECFTVDFDRERAGCTLDEWVTDRIGVRSRHRAAAGTGTTEMAFRAARAALEDSGLTGADLDLIVLSTFTSDRRLPSSVSELQRELGSTAKCFELEAACAGFVDGLAVADSLMGTLGYRTALVVHSDLVSAHQDPERFLLQAIFADGAGAAVLQATTDGSPGISAVETFTDATNCHWLTCGGGALSPWSEAGVADGSYYLAIDNGAIFPFAVEKMAASLRSVVAKAGRVLSDVDWVVAHQTGKHITLGVAEEVGIDPARFLMTLEHTGNTSGATIPIALDHFNRLGTLSEGEFIVMPTVGAGMAWGAVSCTWSGTPAGRAARARLGTEFDLARTATTLGRPVPDTLVGAR
jgi:3-oxoacyl-[acyl-carrier-protein] synthase-3